LRKIPAGDYTIGHTSVSANQPHTVNFPKDYWLGIFEVTKAQYARVVNNDKTSTDTTAQNYVTWNTMRNSAGSGSKVLDSGSFFGRLNNNTKNTSTADPCTGFDLPTISMAETANRAGLLSKYYTGETTTGLDEYANFASNVAVGSKKPNAWGFYDMIGNMRVPCRDTANTGNLATLQPNGLLPITSGTAANPILYGSSTYDGNVSKNDYSQLSFYGTSNAKSASYVDWGIRVAYIPE
ncbi:MAG: SUMF1/EgtB/PvdO family nonheme iron enzyme, partial [Kiritimatiellae bacterium]|nr:SUMF1/EgtB/PvdO family nonheme iron enzyme [Kiritimatiellia bacterium]